MYDYRSKLLFKIFSKILCTFLLLLVVDISDLIKVKQEETLNKEGEICMIVWNKAVYVYISIHPQDMFLQLYIQRILPSANINEPREKNYRRRGASTMSLLKYHIFVIREYKIKTSRFLCFSSCFIKSTLKVVTHNGVSFLKKSLFF